MAIKLTVRGNYRKLLENSSNKALAPYEVEVVVDEIRPDYIQAAVQKALPSKVTGYSSLQTAYPDYETAVEVDASGKAVKKAKAAPKADDPVAKVDDEGNPVEESGDVGGHDENTEVLGAGATGTAASDDQPPAFGK